MPPKGFEQRISQNTVKRRISEASARVIVRIGSIFDMVCSALGPRQMRPARERTGTTSEALMPCRNHPRKLEERK
jgi:hypothetical protein